MASAGATFFTCVNLKYPSASNSPAHHSHPLDLTKVQMQTAKTNTKSTGQFFANIIRTHGMRFPFPASSISDDSCVPLQAFEAHTTASPPPCSVPSPTRPFDSAHTNSSSQTGSQEIRVCSVCSARAPAPADSQACWVFPQVRMGPLQMRGSFADARE